MTSSTSSAGTTDYRPTAQGTTGHGTAEGIDAPDRTADMVVHAARRSRASRLVGVVLLGALVVVGTSAWALSHRGHRAMSAAEALPAASSWCAYNFPPPHDAGSADPNLNTYACRLGFLDGAANPDSDSTPEERRILAAEGKVGATNPQGMWDIAYLAGWTAGHDAARSA
jgi:hypothetical protein